MMGSQQSKASPKGLLAALTAAQKALMKNNRGLSPANPTKGGHWEVLA